MKKRLGMIVTLIGVVATMAGCGGTNSEQYVTLPEYKGLEVEIQPVEVTQDEIDNYIAAQLESMAVPTPITDRAVQNGDTVNINYVGKKDGVAFEGGTSAEEGSDLVIGSGSFIPGFEEGLVGAKIGDSIDLDLTFPDTYPDETLKGQAVVFTVKINSISESVIPELTDEVVPTLAADCKTVDEYKKYVADLLLKQETEQYHEAVGNMVFDQVKSAATMTNPPEETVEKYRKKGEEMLQSYADAYQVSKEEFVTTGLGTTMEEYEAEAETRAQDNTKEYFLVQSIAKKEKLKVTEQEIKEFAKEKLAETGLASEEEYIEKVGKEEIEVFLLYQKVMNALESYAVVKETK